MLSRYWPPSAGLVFGIALGVRLLALTVLPAMTVTPDLEEYRYLAQAIAQRGEYAFREDWRDNPVLQRSPWWFYYDKTGMVRPPGYPVMIAGIESAFGRNDRV